MIQLGMKKTVFCLLGIGFLLACVLLVTLRQGESHVCVLEFKYARTMEFKQATTKEQKLRLREVSLRSLKTLFEDWKYGSNSGEVPLYKRVCKEFLDEAAKRNEMSEETVSEFLRATRFEIADAPAGEMPIKGRIVVDTGWCDVAEKLAGVYADCIEKSIGEENDNWALKATMDRGLVVQNLERELIAQRKRLASRQLKESELNCLTALVASNEVAVSNAKADLATERRKYRETYDAFIVFVAPDSDAKASSASVP